MTKNYSEVIIIKVSTRCTINHLKLTITKKLIISDRKTSDKSPEKKGI